MARIGWRRRSAHSTAVECVVRPPWLCVESGDELFGIKPAGMLYKETRPAACHLTTWRLLTKVGGRSRFFSSRPLSAIQVCRMPSSQRLPRGPTVFYRAELSQPFDPSPLHYSPLPFDVQQRQGSSQPNVKSQGTYFRLLSNQSHPSQSQAAQTNKPSSKKDSRPVPPVESQCPRCKV